MQANYFMVIIYSRTEMAVERICAGDAAKSSFQMSESIHGWRGKAVERICSTAIESKRRGGRSEGDAPPGITTSLP